MAGETTSPQRPDDRPTADLGGAVRALRSVFRLQPRGLSAIVGIGVAASLAEGIGLSLFVPLLEGLEETGASADEWWVRMLRAPFDHLDPDDRLAWIGLCIFVLIALRAALGYLNVLVFARLDARVSHRLRSGILNQLLTVDYRFVERSKFGDLLNTLATETWRTSDALAVVVGLVIAAVNTIVYVVLLLLISVELTVAVSAAMVLIAWVIRRMTRSADELGRRATRANAALADRMVEILGLNSLVRTFGAERREQDRFDAVSHDVSDISMRLARISGAVGPVYQLLSGALLVAVAVWTLRDPGNLSSLLVFIFVLYRLQPQVTRMSGAVVELRSLSAAVEDVIGLLDRSDKPYMRNGTREHVRLVSGIEAREVTFRYDADEDPALRDISVTIPAGKVTALVGPSGAGKSTLVKLLYRFYDPWSGTILVDGVPLTELDVVSWRRSLALVSQDVMLFNGTVADNIRYGRPDATDDEIRVAATKADADGFISRLPDGYDTALGDLGLRLSGGQQQRITLARAIVRDPSVLVLDEATNALDSRSERVIQEALDLLSTERTVIVIAHRLSTVERADHVIVLDEGVVSESGDPASLLANPGLYRQLAELQGALGERG